MTAISFDTLTASKELRSAGVDERAADAIVGVMQRTTELPRTDHLATKEQVDHIRSRVDLLQSLLLASIGVNLAGFIGVASFIYNVIKHA